jgi:endonuclease/exonuclease/phosphatase family metal-dependent hydrolase
MSNSFKILTYNIHKGFRVANIRFVLPQMRDALEDIGADVLFLQEIYGQHLKHETRIKAWPIEPQFKFLAKNSWPHYAYGQNALYHGGHHGNAILSKFPFLNWENIDVSKHKRASRGLLHGTLDIPHTTKKLHVICIHFALFKTERGKQLTTLNKRITERVSSDEPLIIAGDFNDWRGQAECYLETELALQEVFKVSQGHHAKTFPSWRPSLPVDRIYYRGIKLQTCRRLYAMPWRKLSDHVPLYAEFSF